METLYYTAPPVHASQQERHESTSQSPCPNRPCELHVAPID